MSLTNALIKREKIRLLSIESIVEYMNYYKEIRANKSLKYVYHFYTNNISNHIVDSTQCAVKLAYVDYDSDSEEEPCIELEVPIGTNVNYLPISFGQRCDTESEYCIHHVGCMDIENTKKEISIFDPDEYLSYFDNVIENSSLITDVKSTDVCSQLILNYCETIGYKYVIQTKPPTNVKSEQYKILDGKNCVLLTLLHKDYNLIEIPLKKLSEQLINYYNLIE